MTAKEEQEARRLEAVAGVSFSSPVLDSRLFFCLFHSLISVVRPLSILLSLQIEHDRLKVRERAARESASRHGPVHATSPSRPTTSRTNMHSDDEGESYEEWDGEGNKLG